MLDDSFIELSEAIAMVRSQLIDSQARARGTVAGHVLNFAVGKVTVEFAGDMKRVGGGGGDIKFLVAAASLKGEQSTTASHKITVELAPLNADGSAYLVNGSLSSPPPE